MPRLQVTVGPGEGGDFVGELEQTARQVEPRDLVIVQRRRGSAPDCPSEELRVAQRVGNAVRSERILEKRGISDQYTPGTGVMPP